jgi:hypothetical protein
MGSSIVNATCTSKVQATHAASETLSVAPISSMTDRLTADVSMARHALDEVYAIQQGKAFSAASVAGDDGTTRHWEVVAPLGAGQKMLVVSKDSSGAWCAGAFGIAESPDGIYVWTWEDSRGRSRAAIICAAAGQSPKESHQLSHAANSYSVHGRKGPVVRSSDAVTDTISAAGAIVSLGGTPYARYAKWSTREMFLELLDQKRATYRSPGGKMQQVFVTGLSYDVQHGLADISVSQVEEAR